MISITVLKYPDPMLACLSGQHTSESLSAACCACVFGYALPEKHSSHAPYDTEITGSVNDRSLFFKEAGIVSDQADCLQDAMPGKAGFLRIITGFVRRKSQIAADAEMT